MLIIGNLDGDGYLKEPPLSDIAEEAGVTLEFAEQVLVQLQRFDPVGVCARSLSECLLIQARHIGADDEILVKMVTEHLGNLEKKNYQAIARDLKEPVEEIYEAAKVIMSLDPRPGREYSTEEPHYITPDVYVHKVGDKFFVVPNDDGLPKLKISSFYKTALGGNGQGQGVHPGQAALGAVAHPLDPAAAADHRQGHREHHQVPARVLRKGHRALEAAHPSRGGRGHQHARVDHLARDHQQVRAHAAGHLRAEVLLQLGHPPHHRR